MCDQNDTYASLPPVMIYQAGSRCEKQIEDGTEIHALGPLTTKTKQSEEGLINKGIKYWGCVTGD